MYFANAGQGVVLLTGEKKKKSIVLPPLLENIFTRTSPLLVDFIIAGEDILISVTSLHPT